jgi:hypothetical protein
VGSGDPLENIGFNFDKSNKFLLLPKFNEKDSSFYYLYEFLKKTALSLAPRNIVRSRGTFLASD